MCEIGLPADRLLTSLLFICSTGSRVLEAKRQPETSKQEFRQSGLISRQSGLISKNTSNLKYIPTHKAGLGAICVFGCTITFLFVLYVKL